MPSVYRVDVPTQLPSGEVAEWSHWLQGDSLDSALTGAEAFMTSLSGAAAFLGNFTTSTTFGPVKVSEVDEATGVVLATAFGTVTTHGDSADDPMPPQVAIVITLETGSALRTRRGRYYLPAPATATSTPNGRANSAEVNAMADALVAAHQAEMTAMVDGILLVYSRKLRVTTPVSALSVGDVFDTQRRRRDKLVESRYVSPLS